MVNRKSQFIERFGGIDEQHIRPLSEVCTLITDGTHNPPKFVNEGIPFLLVSNITGDVITYDTTKFITEATYNELMKRTPIEIGDVLLSTVGSYGHPALVEDSTKFSFQRHIALLKPNKTLIDSRFLHTSILAPDAQRQIDELVQGVAQKTLNLSAIKKIHIPVPSMDAQAAFIRFVRQSDKSKFTVGRRFKSQFIERFGDPITNPKGWPVMQLQDIVSDDCSISYGIVKPGDDVPDGVPVFRPVDIVGKKPEITELKRTSKAISDQYKRTLLTGRELLLTVRANIGDTCIIGDEFKGCNVGRGIVPIRVKEDLMSLEFLKCQMDFDTMHDYIQSLSKGITLIQLNMEDLRKIAFIVPPVDLQKEYLSIVRQSDKSKLSVQNKLSAFRRLTYRILQFEGGLRNV